MRRHALAPSCFVVLSLLAGAPARAGTVVVAPNGAVKTIQNGVDQAKANDTVLVHPGVYQENVVVGAGKKGLKIKGTGGKGTVVVEARPAGGTGGGPGIRVLAEGVRLENLTIRNALTDGVHAGAGVLLANAAGGATLKKLRIAGSGDAAILALVGAGHSVLSCDLAGNAAGIAIAGELARVEKTRVSASAGDAVAITGNGARLKQIAVDGARGAGIAVAGAEATIAKCAVDFAAVGIRRSAGAGGTIDGNRITSCSAQGILVEASASNVALADNVVLRCGAGREPGIELLCDSAIVEGNRAESGGGDGFRCAGSNLIVKANQALGNAVDGFDADGGMNYTFEQNEARGNGAEGFDCGVPLANFLKNVAAKNRIDFAASSGVGIYQGNAFGSGGQTTAPEID